jgi:surface protein
MFLECEMFNQDLSEWDVGKVENMSLMFNSCEVFNQDLSAWNVGGVTNIDGMFAGCTIFDKPLNRWDVSEVKKMSGMFAGCTKFNQDLSAWNVSQVTDMSEMFDRCTVFNQDLSEWDVSQVKTMDSMFSGCSNFDQPLNWGEKVRSVKTMENMFMDCTMFNQDLSAWDVSQVKTMESMFSGCANFDQPLNWGEKVRNVTTMESMFSGCSSFDQDLSAWNVSAVENMLEMFDGCPIQENNKPKKFIYEEEWVEESKIPIALIKMVEPEKNGDLLEQETSKTLPATTHANGKLIPERKIIISKAIYKRIPAKYKRIDPTVVDLSDNVVDVLYIFADAEPKTLNNFFEEYPEGFVFRMVQGNQYTDYILPELPSDIDDYIVYSCFTPGIMNPKRINHKYPIIDIGRIIGAESAMRVFIDKKQFDEKVRADTRSHKIYILYPGKKNMYKSLAAYSAVHGEKDETTGIRNIHDRRYVGNLHCNAGAGMSGHLWGIQPIGQNLIPKINAVRPIRLRTLRTLRKKKTLKRRTLRKRRTLKKRTLRKKKTLRKNQSDA